MEEVRLRGVVPIVPTPFGPDESIDVESLGAVVDWIAGRGLAAMCLPAYGSEFYKLTETERDQVVAVAVEVNAGRVPVIAQANHVSSRVASGLARRYTEIGADVVSFAIPRQFASSDADIVEYCAAIASSTPLPVLIQDFNPGGPTMGPVLAEALCDRCDNFRFVKLEDPMMVDRLLAIRSATAGRIGILEGWGGMYILEGIGAGIDGIMPGAAIADLLDRVFDAAVSQEPERAHDLFGGLLPYISFSLQDFELFLHIEKRVLVRRGLIASPTVRVLSHTPSPAVLAHIDFLIDQLERLAAEVFDQPWRPTP
ncbi:MAG: dihydrodipicolinate synthase family protein [Acidimicrobiaceae bacterium]|nr:dihydrodipicolinate synthase family protein [Acidimicrobiaceae bacterium]MDE0517800.1 dihydrodipicolinate synthase family protein [Acidimicrobiaceae bacterium]MDE0656273.1 dihydrodipicolinate synthase family protein [Acidimicrobiaceae bacterium]